MVLAQRTVLGPTFASSLARSVRPLRRARPSALRCSFQRSSRRGYASGTDVLNKAGSDMPWLLGSLTVGVGGTYFILNADYGGGHGDHEGHHEDDGHGEEKAESEDSNNDSEKPEEDGGDEGKGQEESEEEDGQKESKDEKGQQESDEKNESSESDSDKGKDTPAESDDEGDSKGENKGSSSKVEGVQFKGKGSKVDDDTKKVIPDAKGAPKKRIDSAYQTNIGGDNQSSAGKEATPGSQHKKQAGLTNTDTRHSTDPSKDPEKSKKGEGTVETAKIQGTVSPDRRQV